MLRVYLAQRDGDLDVELRPLRVIASTRRT